jgi:hypothetical protein
LLVWIDIQVQLLEFAIQNVPANNWSFLVQSATQRSFIVGKSSLLHSKYSPYASFANQSYIHINRCLEVVWSTALKTIY